MNTNPLCPKCDTEMRDVSGWTSFRVPSAWECQNPACPYSPNYNPSPIAVPDMVDPYYFQDPTEPLPAPELTRTVGGKFAGYSPLANLGGEHMPIDSRNWANVAKREKRRLEDTAAADEPTAAIFCIAGVDLQRKFSWRMIAEMLASAAEQAEQTPSDLDAIRRAAYDHLRAKQYDAARTLLDRQIADIPHQRAEDVSETLSNWMTKNWDLIPEIKY